MDLRPTRVESTPLRIGLERIDVGVRRDVARAARVPVLVPRPADARVLFVDRQVDVAEKLGDLDPQGDTAEPGPDDDDSHLPEILDRRVWELLHVGMVSNCCRRIDATLYRSTGMMPTGRWDVGRRQRSRWDV